MTDTTNISKIHTQKPTYKFSVDFIGMGSDVHIGKISKKHAVRFKDRDHDALLDIVQLHVVYGTPQGLKSEIPKWAWKDWIGAEGIDLSEAFQMVVRDSDGNIVFGSGYYNLGMFIAANDNEVIDTSKLDRSSSYLYAKDVYEVHNRYAIGADSIGPFDPSLLTIKTIEIDGCRFIDELWYDGEEAYRGWEHIQQYSDGREVAIIYN